MGKGDANNFEEWRDLRKMIWAVDQDLTGGKVKKKLRKR